MKYAGSDNHIKELISGENNDRKSIYIIIAKEGDTTVETVGKIRAAQIKRNECVYTNEDNLINCVPDDISLVIRGKCEQDWANNFVMKKHCVDSQAKSWMKLKGTQF